MTGDQWASLALAIGCMTLVGSSLLARRLPAKHLIGFAAMWAGIFAVAALVAAWLVYILHNVYYQIG
jgi:hypothetical protein